MGNRHSLGAPNYLLDVQIETIQTISINQLQFTIHTIWTIPTLIGAVSQFPFIQIPNRIGKTFFLGRPKEWVTTLFLGRWFRLPQQPNIGRREMEQPGFTISLDHEADEAWWSKRWSLKSLQFMCRLCRFHWAQRRRFWVGKSPFCWKRISGRWSNLWWSLGWWGGHCSL